MLYYNKTHGEIFFFLINLFIYLFIYFWLHWVFVAACRLSLVAASGGYSSLRCVGFSLGWLLLLWSTGSRRMGFSSCGSQGLERRLSSCGARAWLLCGMWDLPGPGLEPGSPALAGGFLTTAPPGKPLMVRLIVEKLSNLFSFCIDGKLLMAGDYYLKEVKLLGLTGFGKAMYTSFLSMRNK